jgi:hypothetical protein
MANQPLGFQQKHLTFPFGKQQECADPPQAVGEREIGLLRLAEWDLLEQLQPSQLPT